MGHFLRYNPTVAAMHCLSVVGIILFTMDPILLSISLVGALTASVLQNGGFKGRSHFYFLCLFVGVTLLNPLFSHNGATVLFVMNHNPITLEALIYGLLTAMVLVASLYWFRTYTEGMTADAWLYLFGGLSPRLALILSMALRYIPLFANQQKKVKQTQTALGLYKDENIIDRIKGELRVFSVMVTWALENGIVTADSMVARGYGIGKRSRYSDYRIRKGDVILLCLMVGLTVLTVMAMVKGAVGFTVYPTMQSAESSMLGILGYLSYGLLTFLPMIIEGKEWITWKYCVWKI